MASEIVTNLGFLRARNGKAGKLEEALKELAQATRDEPGSLVYEVHHSASNSDQYLVYEIWCSQADLDAHMKAASIQAFFGKLSELVNGPPELLLFKPVDVLRTEAIL